MNAFPDLPTPLRGPDPGRPAAELRFAAESDIPEVLIAHEDDPGLAAALGLRRPPSGAELGRRVEESPAARAGGREAWLTVTDPGQAECRGQLEVGDVDWENRRAAIDVWVAPADRGRGLGAAALALAGRWLLHECGLERIALYADPGNAPLGAAASRAGYRSEGVLRGRHLQRDGRRRDVEILSLIAADLGGER